MSSKHTPFEEEADDVTTGIFADIVLEARDIPAMPEALQPYAAELSEERLEQEARLLLVQWLKHGFGGSPSEMYLRDNVLVACGDPEAKETFKTEVPEQSNYRDGSQSGEFLKKVALTRITMATAKRACSLCPMRLPCLAEGMKDDSEAVNLGLTPAEIFGGWNPQERQTIRGRFEEKKFHYLRGVVDEKTHGRAPEDYVPTGMSVEDRNALNQLAMALTRR